MGREPLDAERKEELLRSKILPERVGVDPEDLGAITGLAALGLTNLAWRNTCVLSGKPTHKGTYKFTLKATNGIGTPAKANKSIIVK